MTHPQAVSLTDGLTLSMIAVASEVRIAVNDNLVAVMMIKDANRSMLWYGSAEEASELIAQLVEATRAAADNEGHGQGDAP